MNEIPQEVRARVRERPIALTPLRELLDGLPHTSRVEALRALGRSDQRSLYEAVDGYLSVSLKDLVPAPVGDLVAVRHHGKNSLPAFSQFEKRFCRPRGVDPKAPDSLYGFNFQSLAPLTGPGYFVAVPDSLRPEVRIDYTRLPAERPAGWPEIRANDRGFSRLVYGFMVDTLRRVSEHVTIGSAARRGRDLGSWFVLCREDG